MLEIIIAVLIVLWLLGYFGRGRLYSRGPVLDAPARTWVSDNLVHLILVLVVILVILRLLGID